MSQLTRPKGAHKWHGLCHKCTLVYASDTLVANARHRCIRPAQLIGSLGSKNRHHDVRQRGRRRLSTVYIIRNLDAIVCWLGSKCYVVKRGLCIVIDDKLIL